MHSLVLMLCFLVPILPQQSTESTWTHCRKSDILTNNLHSQWDNILIMVSHELHKVYPICILISLLQSNACLITLHSSVHCRVCLDLKCINTFISLTVTHFLPELKGAFCFYLQPLWFRFCSSTGCCAF